MVMIFVILTDTLPPQALPISFTTFCIKVYQRTFSGIFGDVCNFIPSCSHYAYQSIKRYKFWGFFMAFDRLIRCNPFARIYARDYGWAYDKKRGWKLWDPPERHTLKSFKNVPVICDFYRE